MPTSEGKAGLGSFFRQGLSKLFRQGLHFAPLAVTNALKSALMA
jgi:hypothetical protein